MKNFKSMILATLLVSSFALQAISLCPFTLINRTDGVIQANIGTQAATISEWVSPLGYKTLAAHIPPGKPAQIGESKCFVMGRRLNKANKLYVRYAGTMPDKSRYTAHEFIINFDDKSLESLDPEGYVAKRYSIRDLFTEIDPKVVVIGDRAMLGNPGEAQIVFFGKAETETNKIEDAALILYLDKHFDTLTGDEVRDFKRKHKLP